MTKLVQNIEQLVNQHTNELREANIKLQLEVEERLLVEKALKNEVEINKAFAELSGKLLSPAEIEDISSLVLEYAQHLTGSKFGYVGSMDPRTGYLICSTLTRDIWKACRVKEKNIVFKSFGDLGGWVLKNKSPIITNDPANDPRSTGTPPGHIPIERFLSVPATLDGKLLGIVSLANSPRDYNEHDLAIVEQLAGLFAIAVNRKRAEEELCSSKERFSLAFNSSPALMAISSLPDGEYIDVNKSWLDVMGYSRGEVIGKTSFVLNSLGNMEGNYSLKELIQKNGSINNIELKFITKFSEERVGLLSGDIITVDGEQCFLSVINDITERKRLEREMLRLDRLNIVGQIAAAIAHEVRNPMTSVRGFLQLIKGKEVCKQFNEYFDLMVSELDRANKMITEFLGVSRNKPVELEKQSLNSIIDALIPLIDADALSSNKKVKTFLGSIPDILLDSKEIRQLILNLTRNAFEAMKSGGLLTISTTVAEGFVYLIFQDQGEGMSPKTVEKLGTPFFTTKEQGTGLGLATCYSIAARHNAVISVSTDSGGTTFEVRFASL